MSDSYRSYTLRTPSYHVAAALPVSIYEPAVYSAVDGYAINGHGFGFDSETHIKAIGEYLERHVAFRAIKSTATGRISEMGLSEAEQSALVKAIQQTCERDDLKGEIVTHVFKLVDVRRLETGEHCSYPAVLVSLHGFSGCLDADFLPVRDTSGNAIHPDPATAFRSALLEFVERQCTTAMWVSRRCNAIFPLGPSLVSHKKAAVICHQMANRGTLMGYDISFLDGASVIFGVYRSSVEGDQVNFACGCAADFTEQSAMLKAFTEVWQTSLLLPQMAFFGVRDYGSNKLKEDFRAANKPDFELGVGVQALCIQGDANSRHSPEQRLLASLSQVSKNLYVFEKDIMISGVRMRFCRILSPDFFIHMSPGQGNNLENRWIDHFCESGNRRVEPLPFS